MTAPNGLATELTVTAWPGAEPRLLRLAEGREDYPEYVRSGGYRPLEDPAALLDEVERSGVLGRDRPSAAFWNAEIPAGARDHHVHRHDRGDD